MRNNSILFLGLLAVILSGCSTTPLSGPTFEAVKEGAAVRVSSARGNQVAGMDYALVDIDKTVLANAAASVPQSFSNGFGMGGARPVTLPLGVGDVVQVAVFESQAGGLFIPAEAGSRPGNYVSLPQQTIDRDGTITVPYAGRVQAVGRSVRDVQAQIERALVDRAIEPQVQISRINSRSAQVSVLGDVTAPSKMELSEAGDRVLDLISRAGGLKVPGVETRITLQRGGRSATVQYSSLVARPSENVYVSPGDTIIVDRDRRTYLVLGASGLNGRFDFEESNLMLSEAIGKAGGLLDSRANPSEVLVYRLVPRTFLSEIGVNVARFTGDTVPVIFRVNFKDPAGFFAARRFPMRDKDIIYIGNAETVEVQKVLGVINSVTSTVRGASNNVNDTRSAVEGF